jgi:SAM-dependent methyltransferase
MERHYGPDYDRLIVAAGETSPERSRVRREILLKHKSSGSLLDLGCSSGSFLDSLKGQSWKLYGIEISADSAKRTEARSGAQVFVGDVLAAAFPPEMFDVVTCFDVLEHLYQPQQVMAKVWEWLKPGGIFYTFVPNVDCWEARVFRSYWYGLELPRHLYHFSAASLRRLAVLSGFREVWLMTNRGTSLDYSIHYVGDALLRICGISRAPLAVAKDPSIPWRAVRKVLRLTVFRLFGHVASMAGAGEGIHAIFRKEIASSGTAQLRSLGRRGEGPSQEAERSN